MFIFVDAASIFLLFVLWCVCLMIRRPPRTTRTDTLCPYTTLFRSVCLVDIGGGTTDICIFTEGAIRHTAVIPIAGDQVTNDIAMALRTPTQYADAIKIRYACALAKIGRASCRERVCQYV